MAKGVFINLKESFQQLWPLGLTVGHQEGDESLTMRPPQLHTPLQLVKYTNGISQLDLMHVFKLGDQLNANNIYHDKQMQQHPLPPGVIDSPVWDSDHPHQGSRRDHHVLYPSRTDKGAPQTCRWPSSGAPRHPTLH